MTEWVADIDKHFPQQISTEWSRNHGPLLANLEANIELKLKNIMILKQIYKFEALLIIRSLSEKIKWAVHIMFIRTIFTNDHYLNNFWSIKFINEREMFTWPMTKWHLIFEGEAEFQSKLSLGTPLFCLLGKKSYNLQVFFHLYLYQYWKNTSEISPT